MPTRNFDFDINKLNLHSLKSPLLVFQILLICPHSHKDRHLGVILESFCSFIFLILLAANPMEFSWEMSVLLLPLPVTSKLVSLLLVSPHYSSILHLTAFLIFLRSVFYHVNHSFIDLHKGKWVLNCSQNITKQNHGNLMMYWVFSNFIFCYLTFELYFRCEQMPVVLLGNHERRLKMRGLNMKISVFPILNCNACKWKSLSCVQLFVTPWTIQGDSPGQNTGVGSLSLLQGIFLTQGSNPGIPHCGWILYQLSHKGRPRILEWVAYPFSSRYSWPRNRTGVSCVAGRFFTNWAIREAPMLVKRIPISSCIEMKRNKESDI